MALIGKLVVLSITILAAFFVYSAMFSHAVTEGGWQDVQGYDTFDKTNDYADFMQNQTNQMRDSLQSQSAGKSNDLGQDLIINLLFNSVSTTVMSFFTFIDILITMVFDIGTTAGIPQFFVGLLVILLLFTVIAGLIRAIRIGEI